MSAPKTRKASTSKKSPRSAKRAPAGRQASKAKRPARGQTTARRADYGAPLDSYFAKQPQPQRAILEELRGIIEKAAPDAEGSIKWGNAFYGIGGRLTCALTSHKSHVNLVLAGPPGTFDDPDGLLQGDGKNGKHLKLTTLQDLPPRAKVQAWVRAASSAARK